MNTKKLVLFSLMIFAVSLALYTVAIDMGMPTRERALLVFKSEDNIKALLPILKESRNEVYKNYDLQSGSELLKLYNSSNKVREVVWEGKKIKVEEEKLHSLRSVLLQNRFPDEQKTLYALSRIKPGELKLDPTIYQYGGLYLYSCGLAIKICSLVGICKLSSDAAFYMTDQRQTALLYTAAKVTGAVAAAFFSVLLFVFGLSFFSFEIGLFSALFACFLPSISFEAHSFKPFAFFLPFWLASSYFAVKSIKDSKHFDFYYFISGIFSGLSAGSMLFGSFSSFSFLAAWFIRSRQHKKSSFLKFLYAPLGFLIAFFLVNPYYILSFKNAFHELTHVGSMHSFQISLSNMLHYSFFELHKILSWPVIIFATVGAFFAIVRRDLYVAIIASPLPFFYFYTANAHWDFPHYSMPLVAVMVFLAGYGAANLINRYKFFYALIFLGLLWNIGNLFYYKKVFVENEKNLNDAGRWINSNIPKGSSIATSVYPYFGFKSYPPFSLLDYSIKVLDNNADYYIVNDINHAYRSMKISYRDEKAVNCELSLSNYQLIASFKRKKNWLDRFYSNWLYVLFEQEISIYKRVTNQSS